MSVFSFLDEFENIKYLKTKKNVFLQNIQNYLLIGFKYVGVVISVHLLSGGNLRS